MRNDLQAAVAHLEAMAQNTIGAAADADMPEQQKTALWAEYKALDTALTALRDALRRQDGCDVCNHDGFDEMVCYIPTENGDGLMVMSNYCPNCGCEISKQAIKYGAGYVDQDILRSAT